MGDFDLFYFFRFVLAVTLSVYFAMVVGVGLWRLRVLLAGNEPHRHLLRAYLSYQLVSLRLRPLRGELVQIGLLLAAFILVCWLHYV